MKIVVGVIRQVSCFALAILFSLILALLISYLPSCKQRPRCFECWHSVM